jgi:hypothetical protein
VEECRAQSLLQACRQQDGRHRTGVDQRPHQGADVHSNNSGQRPSIQRNAPEAGGRPFQFDDNAALSQTISL